MSQTSTKGPYFKLVRVGRELAAWTSTTLTPSYSRAARSLAAQQNNRTVWFNLRAARARWGGVKDKKFAMEMQDGRRRRKPFITADAHERGKAVTSVVPKAASGMLNSEGWAKGNGVGKKHVGIAVSKVSVGSEMAAWGHSFPADEMDGDGRYTGKSTALPALVGKLIAITGGRTFVRKSGFDNAPRNTV